MTKDEYTEKLTKYYGENKLQEADSYGEGYTDGLAEALDYATELSKELDEPKKVVIPQFMADWIEEAKEHYGSEIDPLKIVYWTGGHIINTDPHYEWLENIYNQKLLLNAAINGYEVENKIEKYVRLKGFSGTTGYLNYDVTFEDFFVDTTELDGCTKTKFTKSWLKDNWSEYEAYNNAGLLEFEEAEDD